VFCPVLIAFVAQHMSYVLWFSTPTTQYLIWIGTCAQCLAAKELYIAFAQSFVMKTSVTTVKDMARRACKFTGRQVKDQKTLRALSATGCNSKKSCSERMLRVADGTTMPHAYSYFMGDLVSQYLEHVQNINRTVFNKSMNRISQGDIEHMQSENEARIKCFDDFKMRSIIYLIARYYVKMEFAASSDNSIGLPEPFLRKSVYIQPHLPSVADITYSFI